MKKKYINLTDADGTTVWEVWLISYFSIDAGENAPEYCSPTRWLVQIKWVGQSPPQYLISFPRPLPSVGEYKQSLVSLC